MSISFNPSSFDFTAAGGTKSLTITFNGLYSGTPGAPTFSQSWGRIKNFKRNFTNWTCDVEVDACTESTGSGKRFASIAFTVKPSFGDSQTKRIDVTQNAPAKKSTLSVSPGTYTPDQPLSLRCGANDEEQVQWNIVTASGRTISNWNTTRGNQYTIYPKAGDGVLTVLVRHLNTTNPVSGKVNPIVASTPASPFLLNPSLTWVVKEGYGAADATEKTIALTNRGSTGFAYTVAMAATAVWEAPRPISGYLSAGGSTNITIKPKLGINSSRASSVVVKTTGHQDVSVSLTLTVNKADGTTTPTTTIPTTTSTPSTAAQPTALPQTDAGVIAFQAPEQHEMTAHSVGQTTSTMKSPYVTTESSQEWTSGNTTQMKTSGAALQLTPDDEPQLGEKSEIGIPVEFQYEEIDHQLRPEGLNPLEQHQVFGLKLPTAIDNPAIKNQLLNLDVQNIQNQKSFPLVEREANPNSMLAAKYNYRVHVGVHSPHPLMKSLEDRLMEARASLGIPVHGNNDIARQMKYHMYNRFKVPDKNLAHNKTVTHIFFTRPDLNLLEYKRDQANGQTQNHTEAAILWRRNPMLFHLLTDRSRCRDGGFGAENNFNLLLSNQIASIEGKDEQLTTIEAGRTWSGYEMQYGDQYSGRTAGEFSTTFVDTSDYSIINLIKLWITYIDNVSRGAWSPSYDLLGTGGVSTAENASHVYTKTLDYASSCYVFKCGPDGEDILYWTKYYGIFPVNTGASVLGWELGQNIGDAPRLNINFKYSFKRDLNPISLIEFNAAARPTGNPQPYESSYDPKYNHSSRPYVGCPFVEMYFGNQSGVTPNASIRLKFKPETSVLRLSDRQLYRSSLAKNDNYGDDDHPEIIRPKTDTEGYNGFYRPTEEDNARRYESERREGSV